MTKKSTQTFNTKIYECCGTDELRPVMMCVYFKNGYCYASNGNVVIKQPIEYHSVVNPENLEDVLINRDHYKIAMGYDYVEAATDGLICKMIETGNEAFFYYVDPKNNQIPNYESILSNKRGQTSLQFIGICPEQLNKLSKALYCPTGSVRLQFTGIDTAILVDVVGYDEQQAIIMPSIINDTLFS